MESEVKKKRERDGGDSPDAKRLRENILDDSDDEEAAAADAVVGGGDEQLNVFMKILKEEIAGGEEGGDSRTDLGYLLEATDDELGLPPTAAESPVGSGFSERCYEMGGDYCWEEMPSYEDPFRFFGAEEADYIALDGLFDFSATNFGSADSFFRSLAQ
ncbi:hypothetical protein M569_09941 [Genlisea aurea]|uniref:Uncharacterized protein n=1 Tax=Genlisea aurea TaxID=192259 RepID=S8DPC9_9LAMI|nr:hypothetical protein M569_09941 [Genlisea aurea]